jgi:hypothetical protein
MSDAPFDRRSTSGADAAAVSTAAGASAGPVAAATDTRASWATAGSVLAVFGRLRLNAA